MTFPRPPHRKPASWSQRPRRSCRSCTSNNRELHFSTDESTNRVVIEVRDLDGNVIKTIPPTKALDIMSGDAEL